MWSFALLSSLILLFPGFCCLGSFTFVRSTSPAPGLPPISPQSTAGLSIVIGGSLVAHAAGLAFLNAWSIASLSVPAIGDPLIPLEQASLALGEDATPRGFAQALPLVLFYIIILGVIAVMGTSRIAASARAASLFWPAGSAWLRRILAATDTRNDVAVAYVVAKAGHDGTYAGYEGPVEALSMDSSGQITSITLILADRFTVTIDRYGFRRRYFGLDPIDTINFRSEEIVNISFASFVLTAQDKRSEQTALQPIAEDTFLLYWFGIAPDRG